MKDTVLEEVRRARDALAARFNYDVHALFDELRKQQQEGKRTVVRYLPKTVTPAGTEQAIAPK